MGWIRSLLGRWGLLFLFPAFGWTSGLGPGLLAPKVVLARAFEEAEVVLFGEIHGLRAPLELTRALLPELRNLGVRVFGYEFADPADGGLAQLLVQGTRHRPHLARNLHYRWDVSWSFLGYQELLRALGDTNRGRPRDERLWIQPLRQRVRFEFLTKDPSKTDWSKVFPVTDVDAEMARVLAATIRSRGGKALAYVGQMHALRHSLQKVQHPKSKEWMALQKPLGTHLEAQGIRVRTVLIHSPWAGRNSRFLEKVDRLAKTLGAPFGIDGKSSPWKDEPVPESPWAPGNPTLALGDLCDFYLVPGGEDASRKQARDPGFYETFSLERTRRRWKDPIEREGLILTEDGTLRED